VNELSMQLLNEHEVVLDPFQAAFSTHTVISLCMERIYLTTVGLTSLSSTLMFLH